MSLLLLLLLPSHALANEVVLDGSTWRALQPEDEPEEEKAPPAAVAARTVQLVPADDGLEVRARWEIVALEPGWFHADLTNTALHVDSVRWDGREAAVHAEGGRRKVTGWVDGRAVIELRAELEADASERPVSLDLMPALRGTVEVASGSLTPKLSTGEQRGLVPGDDGAFWTGARGMQLFLAPSTQAVRQDLVMGTAGLGLTFGEGEVRGRARLAWEVRQGELRTVSFSLSGAGADLQVEGANIRAWRRAGDRVTVDLQEPVDTVQRLEASWSTVTSTAAEARMALPTVTMDGTWRTDTTLQLARDGEVEVVPALSGWEPRAASELPSWGQGLVQGTPTSAWHAASRSAGGAVDLLRFEPVPGPAVVVDVASYTAATTEEGRMLLRAHYEVRNERAAHLRIVAPPGMHMVGVRVAGETATPVTDGEDGWLIPLQRSVETVEGLLSFPIELTLLGEQGSDWARREERTLALPRVSAPVAVARATLYLPPGYTSRLEEGEHEVVGSFTEGEGITYGFGVGDVGAAQADALFQEAVTAWMDNDFEGVEENLAKLEEVGASNDNIARLRANMDVVEGRYSGKGDSSGGLMERRVKEQAKARSVDEQIAQKALKKKARESAARGEYEEAEKLYEQVIDISEDLDRLEQDESVEFKNEVASLQAELDDLKSQVSQARAQMKPLKDSVLMGNASATPDEAVSVDFEDITVSGELSFGFGGSGRGGGGAPVDQGLLDLGYLDYDGDGYWMDEPSVDEEPEPEVVVTKDEIQAIPMGRSYGASSGAIQMEPPEEAYDHPTADMAPPRRARRGIRMPSFRGFGLKKEAPPPKAPEPTYRPPPPPPVSTPMPVTSTTTTEAFGGDDGTDEDMGERYARMAETERLESESFLREIEARGDLDGKTREEVDRRLFEIEKERQLADARESERLRNARDARKAEDKANAERWVDTPPPAEPMGGEQGQVDLGEAMVWLQEIGAAEHNTRRVAQRLAQTDPQAAQCALSKATTALGLVRSAELSVRALQAGGGPEELRKIAVARDKARQLQAEAESCAVGGADTGVVLVAESSRRGPRIRLGRGKDTVAAADPASIQLMPEDQAVPQVTAAALSVVVPSSGEAVRYQHLLLPADAPQAVLVRAKKNRKE